MKRILGWGSMAENKIKFLFYRLNWMQSDGTMVNIWQSYNYEDCFERRKHLWDLYSDEWGGRKLLISSHIDPRGSDAAFGMGVYG